MCGSVRAQSAMRTDLLDAVQACVRAGDFGDGDFLELRDDSSSKVGPQFASQILRLVVRMQRPSGEIVEYPLVIKQQMENQWERDLRDMGVQFANEVAMYRDILPFLQIPPSAGLYCPKMLYGKANGDNHLEEDLLILQDVSPEGFVVSKHKLFLDFQHIALALKKLGQFHSWSYTAKKLHPAEFAEKTKLLKIPRFKSSERMQRDYKMIFRRGLQPLLDKNIDVECLNKYAETHYDLDSILEIFFEIKEPFATLIHGDFCKNNIFYKYNNEGFPTECAFFDFQQSKYASPTLDLSFFLYMHTTAEIRKNHWDEFLQIYWNAVEESCGELEIPSFSEFLEEFSKFAVYGYAHCAFFIPMMLADEILPFEDTQKMSEEEFDEYSNSLGGPAASVAVQDIVQHLHSKQYIQKFLEYIVDKYPINK